MKRRDFIKSLLATGALYASGGLPVLGRMAHAGGMPALGNRVLINIMLSGGPDLRHLFPPSFDSNPASYGFRYWEAKAAAHSIEQAASSYQSRWENDYFHVRDTSTDFGILKVCGWLKRMWDAGHVAIVSNAVGGTDRNHSHCRLIMNQGNLGTGPNDYERSGWGGRLASCTNGNVLALTRTPSSFAYGPNSSDPRKHDNSNLISARNTRQIGLYRPAFDESPISQRSHISRSLENYYLALGQEMNSDSIYHRFVEHEIFLREFGGPVNERLASLPVPGHITALMEGALSDRNLGEQIRNLYDCFACSDILSLRVASLEIDGWDTHRNQRNMIEPKLEDLFGDGKALDVLHQELPVDVLDNIVFVLGGEFGRQLRANGDSGTDHGRGTSILIIGNGVRGGVYGDLFPAEELARLDNNSSDITGLTTIDTIYTKVCDWVQAGTGDLVFPDSSLSLTEVGVNLGSLFL